MSLYVNLKINLRLFIHFILSLSLFAKIDLSLETKVTY